MSLYFNKKTETAEHPVYLEVLEISQGGVLVKVDARVPAGLHTLYEGTPMATNATSGEYMFMKSAVVATAKADGATRIVIEGTNPFKIGDYIGIVGQGAGSAATITAVADTYIVTAQTDFTLTQKQIVYETAAANATAPKYRPYGLLRHAVRVRDDDGTTCYNVYGSLVFRGAVMTSNFKWGYPTDVKNRLEDRIRFTDKGLR